jgi:hypothetical protein
MDYVCGFSFRRFGVGSFCASDLDIQTGGTRFRVCLTKASANSIIVLTNAVTQTRSQPARPLKNRPDGYNRYLNRCYFPFRTQKFTYFSADALMARTSARFPVFANQTVVDSCRTKCTVIRERIKHRFGGSSEKSGVKEATSICPP